MRLFRGLFGNFHPVYFLQQEAVLVPVERLVVGIGVDTVAFEDQSVYRLGIENGQVEGLKFVVRNLDGSRFPPWKYFT